MGEQSPLAVDRIIVRGAKIIIMRNDGLSVMVKLDERGSGMLAGAIALARNNFPLDKITEKI